MSATQLGIPHQSKRWKIPAIVELELLVLSVADKKARWPEYNFTDVVKYALDNPGREHFDMVIMSAPTVDISNLDTSRVKQTDNLDEYNRRVVTSCKNMFSLAESSL